MGKTIIGNTAMVNIMSWLSDYYLKRNLVLNTHVCIFAHMFTRADTHSLFQQALYQNNLVSYENQTCYGKRATLQ